MRIIKTRGFVVNKRPETQDDCHPRDKANFLSRFLFCWQLPVIWKFRQNKIADNDFVVAPKILQSEILGKKLEENWDRQQLTKNPSLARALLRTFGWELILYAGFYVPIDFGIAFFQPLYLGKLLDYFAPNQTVVTKDEAYFYGFILTVTLLLKVSIFQYFLLTCTTTGMRMRIACTSLVYQRLLKVRKPVLQKMTSAYIVNLFSNTIDRFDRGLFFIQFLWISVFKLITLTSILYIWDGWTVAVGTLILYGFLLFQGFVGKIVSVKTMKMAVENDNRIRIISDVICGIKTVKMYAWEKYFTECVKTVRRRELKEVATSNHLHTTDIAATYYVAKFPIWVYLLFAVLTQSLDAKLTFMTINAMNIALHTLQFTGTGFTNLSEIRTTINRVQAFLIQSEEKVVPTEKLYRDGIVAHSISAKWETSLVLKNVDFEAASGQLVAVVGPTGCGKSTLLQTILKETTIVGGTLEYGGSLSYASQEPWIFPATLRENIIFGEKENEEKYRKVLRVCALEHDISLFPHGDNTLVGEKGVMLSGGQKARVNLARAIYKDSDIYLLDDPLAAVDVSVGTQIFTECLLGYLKEKTVVLVTHQLKFLRSVDKIYVLENGAVKSCGNYEDLQSQIGRFFHNYEEKKVDTVEIKTSIEKQTEIKEDEGSPTMNRYKIYLQSSGHCSFLLIQILLFILCQCCMSASDLFLTFWINIKNSSTSLSFFTDLNCLYIYSGILLCFIFISHLNTWFFTVCGKRISINLHKKLFDKTLQASMKYFDAHASGRLINRFSRDMSVIDEVIPKLLFELIRLCFIVLGVCIFEILVNYWMVFATLVLSLFFYVSTLFFPPCLNNIKRTANARKSPTFTHVTTTVQGLSTIKGLEAEKIFLSSYHHTQNSFNSIDYLEKTIHFSYGFWMEVVCNMYTIFVIFITVNFRDTSVGNVGLALTQSFFLTWTSQYAMKLYGQLHSLMTSVERVIKYTDLDVEKDDENFQTFDSWPSEGKIVFDSLSMKYDHDKPWALNHINLEIQPGEKIGVVGRTGAGKSSLVSTFLRLYEFEGRILIDGVDTKLVPLKTLRSKLAVIPQDPVFFLGTLRQNLDPFNEFQDDRVWSVLEDVKLKDFVSRLPSGIESPVLEGGDNFSVGQRQLLCLTRAILKNAKIVVFDEATANVDLETDELIQATIRKRFKKSTVLTIAHRLDTVMDSDKILLMADGKVAEFGVTSELLQNVNSSFYKYVNLK